MDRQAELGFLRLPSIDARTVKIDTNTELQYMMLNTGTSSSKTLSRLYSNIMYYFLFL